MPVPTAGRALPQYVPFRHPAIGPKRCFNQHAVTNGYPNMFRNSQEQCVFSACIIAVCNIEAKKGSPCPAQTPFRGLPFEPRPKFRNRPLGSSTGHRPHKHEPPKSPRQALQESLGTDVTAGVSREPAPHDVEGPHGEEQNPTGEVPSSVKTTMKEPSGKKGGINIL